MSDIQRRTAVIKEEIRQGLLETFGDRDNPPTRDSVKQKLLDTLVGLHKAGKILMVDRTPHVSVGLLWEGWNDSQRQTWTFINEDFSEVGELTRRNIDRLNEAAQKSFAEAWEGDRDEIDWTLCPREPYPWWAIPDPKQILLANVTVRPVQSIEFAQFNFQIKDTHE